MNTPFKFGCYFRGSAAGVFRFILESIPASGIVAGGEDYGTSRFSRNKALTCCEGCVTDSIVRSG